MEKIYDMFGLETDASIDRECEERKRKTHEERCKIIDADILMQLHNYAMLDEMACQKTKALKKEFLVNYLMRKMPQVRKGPDSYGKQDFAYHKEFKDKPVDKAMCEKMAQYILETYSHEDGVKYYEKRLSSDSYVVLDKNGVNVNKARYENSDLISHYLEELIRERYPFETNKKFYSSDGERVWTHQASDELRDEARALARKDPKWVNIVEVD